MREMLDNYREHIFDGVVFRDAGGALRFAERPRGRPHSRAGGDPEPDGGGGREPRAAGEGAHERRPRARGRLWWRSLLGRLFGRRRR